MRFLWCFAICCVPLGGCPRGDDGSGVLGLPCQCDDGASLCDDVDICDDLSCVDGLCSTECDLGQQDCPEDSYCTIVTAGVPLGGAWCRPITACLGEAGLDDESLLMARGETLGIPCTAPELGEAMIEGEAFGASLDPTSQRAIFHALEPDSTFGTMLHLGAGIDVSEIAGQCATTLGDVALTVTLPCGALRLGSYEVGAPIGEGDAVLVNLITPIDEGLARSGTVVIDGYDPLGGTLCGSVDVTFNDGVEGRLLGTFQAAAICE